MGMRRYRLELKLVLINVNFIMVVGFSRRFAFDHGLDLVYQRNLFDAAFPYIK